VGKNQRSEKGREGRGAQEVQSSRLETGGDKHSGESNDRVKEGGEKG